MAQANVELGLLQENKITDGVYAGNSSRFHIVAPDALSRHHGVVALFYKELQHFTVEFHQYHGPNVISFHMVKGRQCCHLVGFDLVPRNASTLESVVMAIDHRSRGSELLVARDFNTDLE